MIYNGNRMHSDEQVNEIRKGLKLLKSKKKITSMEIVNTSVNNNSSLKRPNRSEQKESAIPLLRAEWLKILIDICDNVPFIDVQAVIPNTCTEMKCNEVYAILSKAIYETLFNSFKNLDVINVEDKLSITGQTKFLIQFTFR